MLAQNQVERKSFSPYSLLLPTKANHVALYPLPLIRKELCCTSSANLLVSSQAVDKNPPITGVHSALKSMQQDRYRRSY